VTTVPNYCRATRVWPRVRSHTLHTCLTRVLATRVMETCAKRRTRFECTEAHSNIFKHLPQISFDTVGGRLCYRTECKFMILQSAQGWLRCRTDSQEETEVHSSIFIRSPLKVERRLLAVLMQIHQPSSIRQAIDWAASMAARSRLLKTS